MSLLPKLRKRISELVPDVMKLEFGCEFFYEKRPYIFFSFTGMMTDIHQGAHSIFLAKPFGLADKEDILRINEEYKFEILGRDPSLADCIAAIENGNKSDVATISEEINTLVHAYWYLPKPLSGQSDDTLSFLAELLDVN